MKSAILRSSLSLILTTCVLSVPFASAAEEKHGNAFIFEFVVNADLRGVVAANGQAFQVAKKSDFGKIGHVVVVREDSKDCDPFFPKSDFFAT